MGLPPKYLDLPESPEAVPPESPEYETGKVSILAACHSQNQYIETWIEPLWALY